MSSSVGYTKEFKRDAVTESFFQLLKRERVRRRTYKDREARQGVFDYIEFSITQNASMVTT